LVVRLAQENRSWGYDRIAGALHHLGYTISDQTVGNILKRHGILPAPERKKTTTWKEFIRTHMDVLVATDWYCQLVEPEARLRRTDMPLRFYLPLRQPTSCPLSRPNSRIVFSSLGGNQAQTTDAVVVGSVGRWGHTRTRIAGHALLT